MELIWIAMGLTMALVFVVYAWALFSDELWW